MTDWKKALQEIAGEIEQRDALLRRCGSDNFEKPGPTAVAAAIRTVLNKVDDQEVVSEKPVTKQI